MTAEWPTKPLGEVATIVSGATPRTSISRFWGGDVTWLTPKDLGGIAGIEIGASDRRISVEGLQACSAHMVPPQSVIMSSRAPIGHLAINTIPVCTNQGCKSFVPREGILARFLYWVLKAQMAQIQHLGEGCTFDEVSKRDLAEFPIPLPPLAEQRRLVARIEALTGRLAQARQAREAANAEGQSVINAAVHDLIEEQDDLVDAAIRDVCTMKTGKTPPTRKRQYFGGDIPFVCPADIGNGLRISSAKRSVSRTAVGDGKANLFKKGTVLVIGIGATVGKVGIATRDVCANQQITGLTFAPGVLPQYGAWFMSTQREVIASAAAGGGVPIINQRGLSNLSFRYPRRIENQRAVVKKLDALSSKHDSLRQLQEQTETGLATFTPALLAKAFRGEL